MRLSACATGFLDIPPASLLRARGVIFIVFRCEKLELTPRVSVIDNYSADHDSRPDELGPSTGSGALDSPKLLFIAIKTPSLQWGNSALDSAAAPRKLGTRRLYTGPRALIQVRRLRKPQVLRANIQCNN